MEREEIKELFPKLKTRHDVAGILEIKETSLRYFLYKRRPENMYCTFSIKKRNGSDRQISAPQKELKAIQRKLAHVLSCIYEPKICAYGFIESKSIVGNASQHTKRSLVLNVDLKDFFSQIHFGRVRGMLMKPPYSIGEEAATTIAQIACFNGKLPQGAPSSPIITNMICAPLDNALMRLAKSTGCVYTRYADDITFSTYKKTFDKDVVFYVDNEIQIGSKLAGIFEKHSFCVNPEKITVREHSKRQEVTGLTVNVFPNLRRSYIRNLRAILHHCHVNGVYETAKEYISKGFCNNPEIVAAANIQERKEYIESWFECVLKGKINYIKQVKGFGSLTYLSFAQQLNQILERPVFDVSNLYELDRLALDSTFILECEMGDIFEQGSAFYVPDIGLITSYHVVEHGVLYKAYTCSEYKKNSFGAVGLDANKQAANKRIDYAIFNIIPPVTEQKGLRIGDSTNLHVGDQVTVIGYPNHQEGNSPYIQNCAITSKKTFLEAPFYTVSGRIVHGASGGVVLNSKREVIGIIKGGVQTLRDDEDSTNDNQGFVPIHLAIEHMMEGGEKA
jgi:S1-C subfamily serine protease